MNEDDLSRLCIGNNTQYMCILIIQNINKPETEYMSSRNPSKKQVDRTIAVFGYDWDKDIMVHSLDISAGEYTNY